MAKLQKLSKKELETISKNENIPIDIAEQFYLKNPADNKRFITRAGILYKLFNKHPKGVSIEVTIPTTEELERLYLMMNYNRNTAKRLIIMKCTITTPESKFSDYGSASDDNTSNKAYLIEMSSSRSICRCGRLVIGERFCSTEEIEMSPMEIESNTTTRAENNEYVNHDEIDIQKVRKHLVSIIIAKAYDKSKVSQYVIEKFKRPLQELPLDELRHLVGLLEDTANEELFSANKEVNNSNQSLDEQIILAGADAGLLAEKVLVSIKEKWGKELKDLADIEKRQILEKLLTLNKPKLKAA